MVERNGMILAWHHAEGKPPEWEAPQLPEFDDPEWKELMSKGGLKPANFTHSFCEILE